MTQKTFTRFYTDGSMPEIARCKRIPVILDEQFSLVEPVNRWFLSLAKTGLTESTVRAYSDAILDFLRTLGASEETWRINEWEDVRETHLMSYFVTTERKASRETSNQFVQRVMFFYRWAFGKKYIPQIPWTVKPRWYAEPVGAGGFHNKKRQTLSDSIRKPTPSKEVFVYSNDQLRAVAAHLSYRDKLIAKWALLCGLRCFEIASLTTECIRGANVGSIIEVTIPRTKAGTPQNIAVPKTLWGQTLRYVEYERAAFLANLEVLSTNAGICPPNHDSLFINRYGEPISPPRISKNWHKARLQAGLERGVFHDLRHTFADNLYTDLLAEQQVKPNLNINKALQTAVRHVDVATTYKFYISLKQKERALVERAMERRSAQLRWDDDGET
jgi:integrase